MTLKENNVFDNYDPEEVKEWLKYPPEYIIVILGSAVSQEISFLYSVLGMLREDPKIEETVLTYVGGIEKSGQKAIDRMLVNIERIRQLIRTSHIYLSEKEKD